MPFFPSFVSICCSVSEILLRSIFSAILTRLNKEIRLCSWPEHPFTDNSAWKAKERRQIHFYIYSIYTLYCLTALWVVSVRDSNLTHCCLIFSHVPAQTPETDMTEWHTWKDGKKVVKEKAATRTQLEGLTKDSFSGDPDWHPMLPLGIFRPINF